jgi:signal transduction histidine kinase
MRSLLVRIFLSFWLIIGITIGTAALTGFWYAERVRDAFEDFDLGDSIIEASTALEADGREGLVDWLKSFPKTSGITVFVLDSEGNDILDRRLPRGIDRLVDRYHRHSPRPDHEHRDPRNLRRARPLTQLVSDGETFTVVAVPRRDGPLHWSQRPAGLLALIIAIFVSAAVSYLLARAITRPVSKLRDATVEFAGGNMATRVAGSVGGRRDELGMLARDFDLMAAKLQRAALQQTELSRNISHELRSPLARLRVALELARRESGDLAEFDKIDLEAERLDNLIGQILSYTRFDSVGTDNKQQIDLAELISDVVEDVNYECKSSGVDGISVVARIPAAINIDGYVNALTSSVENILRNAVRHSPPNSQVVIALSVNDVGNAIVDISDAGPGVDADELEQLFEPFFRTRRSIAEGSAHGTGLGLAIARRAVQVNGGDIVATNGHEGGLRITITLPLAG